MANVPLPQGTINRLRGSVNFANFPNLNITPAFMGKEMLTLSPQGEITKAIPTATGLVTSPEPYQVYEFSAHILRTNGLGDQFKQQLESSALLGDAVIRSDSSAFGDYYLTNVSIKSTDPIRQNGEDAGWLVHFQGAYQINSSLYNL